MAVVWKKLAYAADVSTEIDGDVSTHAAIKAANATLGHVMVETASLIDVDGDGKLTLGAHQSTHSPNDGSDALDCAAPAELASVQAAGEGSADTLARADHAHQIQESMADNHLVTINAADVAADDYARFTATGGLAGLTAAEVAATMALDDVGTPDALVDFNLQEAHKLVVQTVADDAAKDALTAANTEVGQLLWVTADLDLWICTESVV